MVNNVILVGRITGNPEITELEDGKKVTSVLLAVNRNFKNPDGLYDTDFIRCVLWNSVASTTAEYCRAGDVIGIWSQHMQYKEIYCILPLIYM